MTSVTRSDSFITLWNQRGSISFIQKKIDLQSNTNTMSKTNISLLLPIGLHVLNVHGLLDEASFFFEQTYCVKILIDFESNSLWELASFLRTDGGLTVIGDYLLPPSGSNSLN